MKFNREKFYTQFRQFYKRVSGKMLKQEQVEGLNFLLEKFETASQWKDIRHIAYALATAAHETAWSFEPVEEGFYLGAKAKVQKFQKTLRYYPYFGRGYVQLTHERNYLKAGDFLGADLAANPELALDREAAFSVMTWGMFGGYFTGKKLNDYINRDGKDYKNARRIINGTDKAALIAGYAEEFEEILKKSFSTATKEPAGSQSTLLPTTKTVEQPGEEAKPPSAQNAAPPSDSAIEISKTEVTRTSQGTTTASTVEKKNEQDVSEVVEITQPAPQGIAAKLKAALATLTGGTILYTIAEKFGAMSFSQQSIILIVALAALALIGFMFWAWLDSWKQAQRIKIEANTNADITKKDVKWV